MGTKAAKVTPAEKFNAAARQVQQRQFLTSVKLLADGVPGAARASVIRRRYDLTETEFKQRLTEAGYVYVGRGRGHRAEVQPRTVTAGGADGAAVDRARGAGVVDPLRPWDPAALLQDLTARLEQKHGGKLTRLDLVPTPAGYELRYAVAVTGTLKVLL